MDVFVIKTNECNRHTITDWIVRKVIIMYIQYKYKALNYQTIACKI